MDLGSRAARIGALADATRRALYEYVVAQPQPVGRDRAAAELGLARHTVSFHLDRLADEGLLDVEFRRLSGRSGPGAGRPSKLYRRALGEVAVSLPPRRYDLVGDILATAVARTRDGATLGEALDDSARQAGHELGAGAATGTGPSPPLAALAEVLGGQGFEARVADQVVELGSCPFGSLAQKHTALVCGLNRSFVQGVVDGLGCRGAVAHLEPDPGGCCVKVRSG